MATINPRRQKAGKTRYQATVRRRGYPPQSRTFNHKRDAERWARNTETEMDQGGYVDRREGESTLLCDALERYAAEVSSYKKGWREETAKINYMVREAPFARKGVANVTPTELSAWRDAMLPGRSTSTVRNYLAVLSGFYQHAMKEWRLVDSNPVRAIKWPAPGKARDRRLREGEEARLLEHADAREAAFIELLVGTGMRFSEAVAITSSGLAAGYVHLPETKNSSERDVPLASNLVKTLNACPVEIKTGRLFPWSYDQWRHRFARICKAAGVEGLRTHDLRHEGVSRLQEMGLDVFEIAAISGHKTLAMLGRYTHPKVAALKAKMDGATTPQDGTKAQ